MDPREHETDSREWRSKINRICNYSKAYLKRVADAAPLPNQAVVFDIDETLLDLHGKCIDPVVELYNYAVYNLHLEPFIITNRSGDCLVKKHTITQLTTCGIKVPRTIYFRNPEINDPWRYKLEARKDLRDQGWNIVMSVGDSPWDMGMYGGKGIQLPILIKNGPSSS